MKKALTLALTIGGLFSIAASALQRPQSVKPDVILIVLDALRRDHMSLYGYRRPTTPELDARRAKLRWFTRMITPSPQTAPAVASLFTGQPPRVHGLQFDSINQVFGLSPVPILPVTARTLAERFKAAGYATAAVASNPWIGAEYGFGSGFDKFVGWKEVDPQLPNDGRRVVDQVQSWIKQAPPGPRFVYAHFMDTHAPYEKGHRTFVTTTGKETVFNGKKAVTPADLRYMMDLYDSNIVYADRLVAELFKQYEASGRPWIAAVVSDHGDEFMEHGGLGHGTTLYNELIQVAAVFTGSAVDRYGTSGYPMHLTDVHDMLLGAAGLGDSPLVGLLSTRRPEPVAPADMTRTSEFFTTAALRRGQWKYIVRKEPFGEERYDLEADPQERANLIKERHAAAAPLRRTAEGYWPAMFPEPR